MSEREFRLRRRIDELIDERDALRTKLERARREREKHWRRARALERSRDLWRLRALR